MYGAGQSYAGENYGGQFSSPALPVTVPNCKADSCMNPAFYDPEVGMFDYCSPSCRDTYLLPKEKLKLQTDIHELEEQLQAVGVAQKKLCPSVKASSVDPPRTSTNCEMALFSSVPNGPVTCLSTLPVSLLANSWEGSGGGQNIQA